MLELVMAASFEILLGLLFINWSTHWSTNLTDKRKRNGLTLFRNRNTYNDDKKSPIKGFRSYWSMRRLLNSHMSVIVCRIGLPNFLKREI